jgi:hypothetical protein
MSTIEEKQPWMRDDEIEVLESLFQVINTRHVFEIGSGGSSIYFPNVLRETKPDQFKKWVALESNQEWYDRVVRWAKEEDLDCLEVRMVDSYRSEIANMEGVTPKFDVFIVDSGNRQELLHTLNAKFEEADWFVILHDSGRFQYRHAIDSFDHGKHLTIGNTPDKVGYKENGLSLLWNGEVPDQIDEIKNSVGGFKQDVYR